MVFSSGFAGDELDVEVGHLLGLRWFHLSCAEHAIQKITNEPIEITAFGDPGPIYIPAPTEYRCKCGYVSHFPPFPPDHPAGGVVPQLRGARGLWHPGENAARCLNRGSGGGGGGQAAIWVGGNAGWTPVSATGAVGGSGGGSAGGSSAYSGSNAGGHEVPGDFCGCGFWNYWSLGEIQVSSPAVVGVVKGYGNYISGELGFRCSHAKIEAIYLPHYDMPTALAIEDHYQVDVYSNFLAMLEMFKDATPPEQPPLTDSYFCKGGRGSSGMAMVQALRSFAYKCEGCGHQRCAQNQKLCASCQAYGVPQQQQRLATKAGREAAEEIHKRREQWMKGATRMAQQLAEVTLKLEADTTAATKSLRALTDAIEHIKRTYGKPPDGRRY